MNDLGLPPRRTLPSDVRERIRDTIDAGTTAPRSHTRIAMAGVAAGVAVLAVGAVVIAQSVAGTPDDFRPGAGPHPSTTSTATAHEVPAAPDVRPPDALSTEDLDRCGTVAAASPRAREFAPRSAWEPVFSTTAPDGSRLTAFREYGGKPGFCEVHNGTATVADPSTDPMDFDFGAASPKMTGLYALYVSPSGVLAGVAQNVGALEFSVVRDDLTIGSIAPPVLEDELFVVNLGELSTTKFVQVVARDQNGLSLGTGTLPYDPATVRPVGAQGPA